MGLVKCINQNTPNFLGLLSLRPKRTSLYKKAARTNNRKSDEFCNPHPKSRLSEGSSLPLLGSSMALRLQRVERVRTFLEDRFGTLKAPGRVSRPKEVGEVLVEVVSGRTQRRSPPSMYCILCFGKNEKARLFHALETHGSHALDARGGLGFA